MEVFILNKAEVATKVAREISNLVKNKPNAILGLATGSTPEGVYEAMVKIARQENITYENVQTFNLDEYLGRFPLEQSYHYFMNIHLLDHLDFNKKNTHFPSKKREEQYDQDIDKAGGIDLQLLGMGVNGHIGFNEPGTSEHSKTHVTYLSAETIIANARFFGGDAKAVPNSAVTMGLATILKAKKIIIMAFGHSKAEAVKHLVEATKFDIDWPLTVLYKHPNVTVYIDEEAASFIEV